ncbi:MAG: S1 family peptidase [Actinomycetota bacterium]|nr:S1 family peptidase [Actinomycetota bacterium]
MLPRSRSRSLAAAALGVLLSLGIALPASAAPEAPDSLDAAQQLVKEVAAGAIVSTLGDTLGSSFAGAWLDPVTSDLVVAITDPAAVEQVRAAGAEPRLVARNLQALQSVMSLLDSRSAAVPDSVTGWYVDPASNSVVVSATDPAAAKAFTSGQDAVRIERVDARPVPLAGLRGGDTMTSNSGQRCSVGFNAISGGIRYIITAGHCTKQGGTWTGPDGRPIGPAAESSFPGDDFGLVEVTSSAWEQTDDVGTGSGNLTVTGDSPAPVGSKVCMSGSTSGFHCGQVKAVGETVNYGNGDVVRGLTRTSVCAEPGDSGGPFLTGTEAQGMLSGGTGGCLLGGQSYFQPVQEVLTTYGLTLITGRAAADNSRS